MKKTRISFFISLSAMIVLSHAGISAFAVQEDETAKNEAKEKKPNVERLEEAGKSADGGDKASWGLAVERAKRRADLLKDGAAATKSRANDKSGSATRDAKDESRIVEGDSKTESVTEVALGPPVLKPDYSLDKLRSFVEKMQPGRWYPLPGDPMTVTISREDTLQISEGDADAADRLWGWGGPGQVYNSYSGAAFDGRRIYFFGGGHHMYRGNEITVYDLETLSWKRLYEPSYVTDETYFSKRRFVPRRGPRSVHTYDGTVYSPIDNSLYLWGSRGIRPWRFDLSGFEEHGDPWRAWKPLEWPEGFKDSFQKTALLPDGRILVMAAGRGTRAALYDPRRGKYVAINQVHTHISSLELREKTERLYAMRNKGEIDVHHLDGTLAKEAVGKAPDGMGEKPNLAGMVYDSLRDRFVFWPGKREVWTWDPDKDEWEQFPNLEGPAPTSGHQGIYSKWIHIPQLDVFLGMGNEKHGVWAYKVPVESRSDDLKADLQGQGFQCADVVFGWECEDLQAQIDRGKVEKGVYTQCGHINRSVDFQGSRLQGKVCGQKAALIAQDGAVIENVEMADLTIGVNAACVRWEGGTVILRNVHCHDSDMGLLGQGERLVIEDSIFERTINSGANHGHIIYAAKAKRVEIRDSTIRNPGNEGHVLKSGAQITWVEGSVLEGGDRPYSRLVDTFNGGDLTVRNTQLRVGPHGGNGDLIGYGAEMRERHSINRVAFEGGSLICSGARIYNSLHIWPDRLVPESIDWQPDMSERCPPPPRL